MHSTPLAFLCFPFTCMPLIEYIFQPCVDPPLKFPFYDECSKTILFSLVERYLSYFEGMYAFNLLFTAGQIVIVILHNNSVRTQALK